MGDYTNFEKMVRFCPSLCSLYSAPLSSLFLVDPPSITSTPLVHREQQVGDGAVSHPCVASGYPAPAITWFHNGEVVSDGGGVTVGADNTLTIAEPLVNHSGIYQCIVANDFGVVTRVSLLEVRERGMHIV